MKLKMRCSECDSDRIYLVSVTLMNGEIIPMLENLIWIQKNNGCECNKSKSSVWLQGG